MKHPTERHRRWTNAKGRILPGRAIQALESLGIDTPQALHDALAADTLDVRALTKLKNVGRGTVADIRLWAAEDGGPSRPLPERCHACGQVLPPKTGVAG